MASAFRTNGKKIVAIGRNYAAHALELKNAIPTEPFFFLKPTTSYLSDQGTVQIPKGVECHYEVELGVVIGKLTKDVDRSHALDHVGGYALSIDMTARNLQEKVKSKGLPWSSAKGFDTFNPVSDFIPKETIPDPARDLRLWLKVNDQLRQDGKTDEMIFDVPTLIEHVSSIMTLEEGDLLLTGTPSGVGRVVAGDVMTAGLEHGGKLLKQLRINVADRVGGYEFKP
ncbi:hypothetical protein IE53DRAFT_394732 [Violaceomyces palustris]|uniref:Uncharacterized protein n=1 Tax=Violaceomyces palustris TaxID=1673888 RepID=A0ACD0NYA6_9BASI|nr:hypothetical protein IE53DRAFT_394732 [Violaceomyces palustris]